MQLVKSTGLKQSVVAASLACSVIAFSVVASPATESVKDIPVLSQERQHAISAKRISDQFLRSHYKKISIDDELSVKMFDRFIKSLDQNKNFFLTSDISSFEKSKNAFDEAIRLGKLDVAYDIFQVSLQRRAERFEYALSLLDSPFNFEQEDDKFYYDREDAKWANTAAELNEVWRQRVKYDALNLKLADKNSEEIVEVLTKRYNRAIRRLTQTNSEDVFQTVMNSFARSIEAHTSYLSPRNTERFQMQMNLSLEGIGAVLRDEDDFTTIVSVVAGGPADKSKAIKPEDKIIAVAQDGEEFVDVVGWRLDDVVDLIKGPKGTSVRLQVQKGTTSTKKIQEVVIVRDKVKLEDRAAQSEVFVPDTGEHKGEKLGVISIPSFYHNLHVDVKKELDALMAEDVKGIIVDLRGNGGGSLPESIYLSGLFIDKGPVVQVRYENGRVNVDRDTDGVVHYAGPLTVLVDRYSASASEIFAAAMQDYNRAIIIGEQTFGKGTVQQHRGLGRIYDLYENPLGAVQYTIAKFYRISGGSTQHKGVKPDISYPSAVDPAEWGESKEENALPYDSIQRANYSTVGSYEGVVDVLGAKHSARALKDPEFAYIFEDIEEYNRTKNDKFISLVESERLSKKSEAEQKQLQRVNERLVRLGLDKVTDLEGDLPEALEKTDPFLAEAANITFDMISSGSFALNLSK